MNKIFIKKNKQVSKRNIKLCLTHSLNFIETVQVTQLTRFLNKIYESVVSQEKDPFKLFPDFKGLLLADCNSFMINHMPPDQIENLLSLTKTILTTSSSE